MTNVYKNGNSGYIVFANGLILQWGLLIDSTRYISTITFPKSFATTQYYFGGSIIMSSNTNGGWECLIQKQTTTNITVQRVHGASQTNTCNVRWFACGY